MTGPLKSRRWCFSTLGCPELTLPEACALAGEFDVAGIELRALCDSVDLPKVFQTNGWDELAPSIWGRSNVRPIVAGSSFKLVSSDVAERETLISYAGWADALGIPFLRVFGGGTWGTAVTDAAYEAAIANLDWWRAERRGRGWSVEMLIETHDAFSASGPCLELQRRSESPLEWIWDSHHTWRLGRESPEETWARLGPSIRHVHIKDSIDVPSKRHPFTYVLPGEGQMPMDRVVTALRSNAFTGYISLEWEKMWHPYLPPLRTALMALRQFPWFKGEPGESEGAAIAQSIPATLAVPFGGAT